jgi:hypothetical protein
VTRLYILGPEIGQPRAELRISNCGLHHIIVSTFFLVNEKEKTPKLVKKGKNFCSRMLDRVSNSVPDAETEFKTRS